MLLDSMSGDVGCDIAEKQSSADGDTGEEFRGGWPKSMSHHAYQRSSEDRFLLAKQPRSWLVPCTRLAPGVHLPNRGSMGNSSFR